MALRRIRKKIDQCEARRAFQSPNTKGLSRMLYGGLQELDIAASENPRRLQASGRTASALKQGVGRYASYCSANWNANGLATTNPLARYSATILHMR